MIDFPIVDTHVHLLDIRKFKYSWASGAPKLGRNWTIADLEQRAAPYFIDSFVFVEVDADMPQHIAEAEWVQSLANDDPRLKGCVASLPLEQGLAIQPDMERLAKLPVVRGIRRLIQNKPDPDFVLRPGFLAAVRLLPRYNFSFDICIYHHQFANTLKLVRQCPEVPFILDHIAKARNQGWAVGTVASRMREMAALPNVMCKLSVSPPKPITPAGRASSCAPTSIMRSAVSASSASCMAVTGRWRNWPDNIPTGWRCSTGPPLPVRRMSGASCSATTAARPTGFQPERNRHSKRRSTAGCGNAAIVLRHYAGIGSSMQSYDFIITGGGSAGCALAARLSEDPGVKVLLLEAGGTDTGLLFQIPQALPK